MTRSTLAGGHKITSWENKSTPLSSPDLNPIENMGGSMKQYLRTYKTMADLKTGIKHFWKTLTPQVCSKYTDHLHEVVPEVIDVNGGPSGY